MKIWAIVLALALVALPASAQVTTYDTSDISTSGGDIYITQASYTPFPASPGTYIDVWYRVENRGSETLRDVALILKPDGPFSLDASESASKKVGSLPTMQSALVKFRVRVAEDALQGDHDLKFTWDAKGIENAPVFSSAISVRSSTPLLVVGGVTVSPAKLMPGDKATVSIELTNAGDSFLRYVTASLQLVSVVTSAAGTTVSELPFTPAGKGISESIINLAPGKSETLHFEIVAAPDAESRSYKLPVSINYVDNTGRNNSHTEIVGLAVAAEPDLLVYVDRNDLVDTVAPADVVLRFVNRGRADIKFLTVTLQDKDGYTLLNAPTQYVGEVASDDYETASWSVKLDAQASGIELPVVVTYEDVNAKKYSTALSVPLVIHSAEQKGTVSSNTGLIMVIALVIIVIAVVIWRRRRGKNKRA